MSENETPEAQPAEDQSTPLGETQKAIEEQTLTERLKEREKLDVAERMRKRGNPQAPEPESTTADAGSSEESA